MKVNYRYEHGSTDKASKFAFRHIKRLGAIRTIEGYRFSSRRSYIGEEDGERHYWSNTHERLRVRGENGQCLIDGVCWGYGGTGPRALLQMLEKCGVPTAIAEYVAFNAPRNDKKGVDWSISIGPNGKLTEIKFQDEKFREAA